MAIQLLTILILLLCIVFMTMLYMRCSRKKNKTKEIELFMKYKTIFDNALIGIRLYDSNGFLIEANELSCSIYGVTKDELFKINTCIFNNPIYAKILDRNHPQPFSGILENNYDELIHEAYFVIGLPRGVHYVDTRINPVYDETEHLKFIVVTYRDVTESVNAKKQLEVERNNARASDRLKSEFLSNMSHEIRTPLNAIVGFSDVMCKYHEDNQEMKECQNMINQNSQSLLNLINNILELSKIESGNIDMDNVEFNLSEVFLLIYSQLKPQNPHPAEIQFTCDVPLSEYMIKADKTRLKQLLVHLVHNSFKYTQKGSIKMTYEINPDGITIIVSDTGIGIPENKVMRIFKRFEKLDSFKPGTGLGLSICKALVDSIGGKINVQSTIGKGTTFYIWYPVISE